MNSPAAARRMDPSMARSMQCVSAKVEFVRRRPRGDRPGRMLWSIDGRKFERADQLPQEFRAALLAAVPDALSRPLE